MLRKGQEGHVRAERDILKSASLVNSASGAEWIVRLYYSFQDRDHLYLVGQSCIIITLTDRWKWLISFRFHCFLSRQVLEYMGGGDLLNLLIERDIFDEGFTRFYVAEVGVLITYSSLSSTRRDLCLFLRRWSWRSNRATSSASFIVTSSLMWVLIPIDPSGLELRKLNEHSYILFSTSRIFSLIPKGISNWVTSGLR